jgi:hypothetical protein
VLRSLVDHASAPAARVMRSRSGAIGAAHGSGASGAPARPRRLAPRLVGVTAPALGAQASIPRVTSQMQRGEWIPLDVLKAPSCRLIASDCAAQSDCSTRGAPRAAPPPLAAGDDARERRQARGERRGPSRASARASDDAAELRRSSRDPEPYETARAVVCCLRFVGGAVTGVACTASRPLCKPQVECERAPGSRLTSPSCATLAGTDAAPSCGKLAASNDASGCSSARAFDDAPPSCAEPTSPREQRRCRHAGLAALSSGARGHTSGLARRRRGQVSHDG